MSYCLLDAARMEEVLEQAKTLAGDDQYFCLYKGIAQEQLGNVAPYLFLTQPAPFVDWLFAEGWGKAWGIYVLSETQPDLVYKHFRQFLMVKTEAGAQLYFRFYDPRVLRQFLPTCTPVELKAFFGPVRYFLAEDEDPHYGISYWLENDVLKSQRMTRQEAETAYIDYLRSRPR